jgi:formylglycine-generating enzyme required for sulfatase activity
MISTEAALSDLDRAAWIRRYRENRARSAELFGLFAPDAYEDRPIPLRHPFVFYEGHLPAFSYNKLVREALGGPSLDADFEVLFERGIDPASAADAQRHERAVWPERARVHAYGAACDAAIVEVLANANLTDAAASPLLERAQAVYAILEHEEMHHETLMYIIHRLPNERKRGGTGRGTFVEAQPAARGRVAIPGGNVTLGARRDALAFGWDNEFEECAVAVRDFEVDVNDVTNGEWLQFVREGGPLPPFWIAREGAFRLLGAFEEMPLPLSWPVYVGNAQAQAYAAWRGGRLMSEAEYHRAAFGTPSGQERAHPWGDAEPVPGLHGNFGFARFDPEPVGIRPAGASAWGVHDLVGNGWEWTATEFAPFPGFAPMASYPPYSADFFDGDHVVMKGASPVTSRHHVRRSFRNWYRREYPYMFATFRVAYD